MSSDSRQPTAREMVYQLFCTTPDLPHGLYLDYLAGKRTAQGLFTLAEILKEREDACRFMVPPGYRQLDLHYCGHGWAGTSDPLEQSVGFCWELYGLAPGHMRTGSVFTVHGVNPELPRDDAKVARVKVLWDALLGELAGE